MEFLQFLGQAQAALLKAWLQPTLSEMQQHLDNPKIMRILTLTRKRSLLC